jgi:hypothetical protein
MSNFKKHYFFLMPFAAVILFLSFLGCAGAKKEAAVAPPLLSLHLLSLSG